tara:strand:- start:841 stop:1290 length:450 start_codon:yes stop_codon:yes gene_type:complete
VKARNFGLKYLRNTKIPGFGRGFLLGKSNFLFRLDTEIAGAFALGIGIIDVLSDQSAANKFADCGRAGRHSMVKSPVINDFQLVVIKHDLELFCSLRRRHLGVSCHFQGFLKPPEAIENQSVQEFWSNLRYRCLFHNTTILLNMCQFDV